MLQLVLLRQRSNDFNGLEIVVLGHELPVLRRQARRPQLTSSDITWGSSPTRTLRPRDKSPAERLQRVEL
jgi:hypothetical protein